MTKKETPAVAALVVGFFPDLAVLNRLLTNLLGQAGLVVFADNGGGGDFLAEMPTDKSRVHYLDMGGNKGLGFALNQGLSLVASQGYEFVATFDQDSDPPSRMLAGLLAAHGHLREQGVKCAAIGPRFYDRREGQMQKFPMYREIDGGIRIVPDAAGEPESGLQEVDVLITSGMMVNVAAWQAGITYNAGLFVDYTDTDWCFRARAAGYHLFACLDQEMGHALSDSPPVRVLGVHLLRYTPIRRYYYFRNTLFFIRQPYVSRAWRKRLLMGLALRFVSNVFIDRQKWAGLKMMLRGTLHGIQNRLDQP